MAGLGEESKDLWDSVRPPHTPDNTIQRSPIPLPIPSDTVESLIATLNIVVAAEQPLRARGLLSRDELYKWLVRTSRSGRPGFF
jgi:hypothetical protein